MTKHYKTSGTCARSIDIETDENGIIRSVVFNGGCAGNTEGISRLVVGMESHRVADLLRGTDCNMKGTSCPDQHAKALDEMRTENP